MDLRTHKLHKYLKSKCEEYIESKRSIYYKFGQHVLRLSDHIGKNSSGSYSIIVDKRGNYLLHTHSSGAVTHITYEEVKTFIKAIDLTCDVAANVGLNWDKEVKSQIPQLTDENRQLKQKLEKLERKYALLQAETEVSKTAEHVLGARVSGYRALLASLGIEDTLSPKKTKQEKYEAKNSQ
jgi:hypothetical protein